MAHARFSKLTVLDESVYRIMTLLKVMPYVKMTTPGATLRDPDILTPEGKKVIGAWAGEIFSVKSPDQNTVQSRLYIFDEMLHFYDQLMFHAHLASQNIADEKARVNGKLKKVLPQLNADEQAPLFVAMMPKSEGALQQMAEKLGMLSVIVEKVLAEFNKPSSNLTTKYPLDRLHYVISSLNSAVVATLQKTQQQEIARRALARRALAQQALAQPAIQEPAVAPQSAEEQAIEEQAVAQQVMEQEVELETRQEMAATAVRIAELDAARAEQVLALGAVRVAELEAEREAALQAHKEAEAATQRLLDAEEQRVALEARQNGQVRLPPSADELLERKAIREQEKVQRIRNEHKQLTERLTRLSQAQVEQLADLNYSKEKFAAVQDAIFAMSSIKKSSSVASLSVDEEESKEHSEARQATPTSESSSSTSARPSVNSAQGGQAPVLAATDAKKLKKFSGKNKVRELASRITMVTDLKDADANNDPIRLEKLKYWTTLISYITTKNTTSEKGYSSMGSFFFSPSSLRIKIENDLIGLLNKHEHDHFEDFEIHNMWAAGGKNLQEAISLKRQAQKDEWFEKVTIEIFARAIPMATTMMEVNLVLYAWLNLLVDTKDIQLRDSIIMKMHKAKLIDSLFEKLSRTALAQGKLTYLEDGVFQYIVIFPTTPGSAAEKAKITTLVGVFANVLRNAVSELQINVLAQLVRAFLDVKDLPLRDGVLTALHQNNIIDRIFEKLYRANLLEGTFLQYIDSFYTKSDTAMNAAKIATVIKVFRDVSEAAASTEKVESLAELLRRFLSIKDVSFRDGVLTAMDNDHVIGGIFKKILTTALATDRINLLGDAFFQYINVFSTRPDTPANKAKVHTVVEVFVEVFADVLQNIQQKVGHLAELVHKFLGIKDTAFRNGVLQLMHEKNMLDVMLATVYPVSSVRDGVKAKFKLPEFRDHALDSPRPSGRK
jgi:hypothetical protein